MKKILLILIFCMFCLSGCSNNELTMENKIIAEIEYVKKHSSIFIKKFDDNEYLKDGVVDTEKLKYDTKVFIDSLSVIEDDLRNVKLDDEIVNNIDMIVENINVFSEKEQYDGLKNEYINLYKVFETLEK